MLMGHNQWGRSQNNGLVLSRNISPMLTTLGYNVREMIQWSYICVVEMSFALLVVPMDLDVKMKAVMLGACFLIVSIAQDTVYACLFILWFLIGFYVL